MLSVLFYSVEDRTSIHVPPLSIASFSLCLLAPIHILFVMIIDIYALRVIIISDLHQGWDYFCFNLATNFGIKPPFTRPINSMKRILWYTFPAWVYVLVARLNSVQFVFMFGF